MLLQNFFPQCTVLIRFRTQYSLQARVLQQLLSLFESGKEERISHPAGVTQVLGQVFALHDVAVVSDELVCEQSVAQLDVPNNKFERRVGADQSVIEVDVAPANATHARHAGVRSQLDSHLVN